MMKEFTIAKDTPMMIGTPSERPEQLLTALAECAATLPHVQSIHLAYVFETVSGAPPRLVLLIETDANIASVAADLAAGAKRELDAYGKPVDFMPLRRDVPDDPFAKLVREQRVAIFERKRA